MTDASKAEGTFVHFGHMGSICPTTEVCIKVCK